MAQNSLHSSTMFQILKYKASITNKKNINDFKQFINRNEVDTETPVELYLSKNIIIDENKNIEFFVNDKLYIHCVDSTNNIYYKSSQINSIMKGELFVLNGINSANMIANEITASSSIVDNITANNVTVNDMLYANIVNINNDEIDSTMEFENAINFRLPKLKINNDIIFSNINNLDGRIFVNDSTNKINIILPNSDTVYEFLLSDNSSSDINLVSQTFTAISSNIENLLSNIILSNSVSVDNINVSNEVRCATAMTVIDEIVCENLNINQTLNANFITSNNITIVNAIHSEIINCDTINSNQIIAPYLVIEEIESVNATVSNHAMVENCIINNRIETNKLYVDGLIVDGVDIITILDNINVQNLSTEFNRNIILPASHKGVVKNSETPNKTSFKAPFIQDKYYLYVFSNDEIVNISISNEISGTVTVSLNMDSIHKYHIYEFTIANRAIDVDVIANSGTIIRVIMFENYPQVIFDNNLVINGNLVVNSTLYVNNLSNFFTPQFNDYLNIIDNDISFDDNKLEFNKDVIFRNKINFNDILTVNGDVLIHNGEDNIISTIDLYDAIDNNIALEYITSDIDAVNNTVNINVNSSFDVRQDRAVILSDVNLDSITLNNNTMDTIDILFSDNNNQISFNGFNSNIQILVNLLNNLLAIENNEITVNAINVIGTNSMEFDNIHINNLNSDDINIVDFYNQNKTKLENIDIIYDSIFAAENNINFINPATFNADVTITENMTINSNIIEINDSSFSLNNLYNDLITTTYFTLSDTAVIFNDLMKIENNSIEINGMLELNTIQNNTLLARTDINITNISFIDFVDEIDIIKNKINTVFDIDNNVTTIRTNSLSADDVTCNTMSVPDIVVNVFDNDTLTRSVSVVDVYNQIYRVNQTVSSIINLFEIDNDTLTIDNNEDYYQIKILEKLILDNMTITNGDLYFYNDENVKLSMLNLIQLKEYADELNVYILQDDDLTEIKSNFIINSEIQINNELICKGDIIVDGKNFTEFYNKIVDMENLYTIFEDNANNISNTIVSDNIIQVRNDINYVDENDNTISIIDSYRNSVMLEVRNMGLVAKLRIDDNGDVIKDSYQTNRIEVDVKVFNHSSFDDTVRNIRKIKSLKLNNSINFFERFNNVNWFSPHPNTLISPTPNRIDNPLLFIKNIDMHDYRRNGFTFSYFIKPKRYYDIKNTFSDIFIFQLVTHNNMNTAMFSFRNGIFDNKFLTYNRVSSTNLSLNTNRAFFQDEFLYNNKNYFMYDYGGDKNIKDDNRIAARDGLGYDNFENENKLFIHDVGGETNNLPNDVWLISNIYSYNDADVPDESRYDVLNTLVNKTASSYQLGIKKLTERYGNITKVITNQNRHSSQIDTVAPLALGSIFTNYSYVILGSTFDVFRSSVMSLDGNYDFWDSDNEGLRTAVREHRVDLTFPMIFNKALSFEEFNKLGSIPLIEFDKL